MKKGIGFLGVLFLVLFFSSAFAEAGNQLTIDFLGDGGGTVSISDKIHCIDDCSQQYPSNSWVLLKAQSNADSSFLGWGGCFKFYGKVCAVHMNGDKTVFAKFIAKSKAVVVTANPFFVDATESSPTGVRGVTNVKIASFVVDVSDETEITQISLKNSSVPEWALGYDFKNLKLMNGGTQIGFAIGTLLTNTPAIYLFMLASPITCVQQYVVDVYADILTSASNIGVAFVPVIFDGIVATDRASGASIGSDLDVNGQNVYILGSGSLFMSCDGPNQNISMGVVDQVLMNCKLIASGGEDVSISKIIVADTASTGLRCDGNSCSVGGGGSYAMGSIINFKWFRLDGTQVGSTVSYPTSDGRVIFEGLDILAHGELDLILRADINTYPNAASGSIHTFGIGEVVAVGATSGERISIVYAWPVTGISASVYRSELTVANAMSNFQGGQSTDQLIGKFRFTNTSTGNYTVGVSDINLGLESTITNSAPRTVTIRRDHSAGPIIAQAIVFGDFSNITEWNVTPFEPFWIDAMDGVGHVDIYVSADTVDANVSDSITSSIIGATWSDGITYSITTLDNTPIQGATVTY